MRAAGEQEQELAGYLGPSLVPCLLLLPHKITTDIMRGAFKPQVGLRLCYTFVEVRALRRFTALSDLRERRGAFEACKNIARKRIQVRHVCRYCTITLLFLAIFLFSARLHPVFSIPCNIWVRKVRV